MITDIGVQLETACLLAYQVTILANRGENFTLQASMARLTTTELAMKASTEGIQMHGVYGYMMDSSIHNPSTNTCIVFPAEKYDIHFCKINSS